MIIYTYIHAHIVIEINSKIHKGNKEIIINQNQEILKIFKQIPKNNIRIKIK